MTEQIVLVCEPRMNDDVTAESLRFGVSKAQTVRELVDGGLALRRAAETAGIEPSRLLELAIIYADSFAQPEKATTRVERVS